MCDKLTLAEEKWFASRWNYDDDTRDKLTLAEAKWFARRWNYDDVKRDKVGSGEYVLGRPPKKPGGTKRIALFILCVFMAIDGVQNREEGDNMPLSFKFYF